MSKLITILFLVTGLCIAFGYYRLPIGWMTPSLNSALSEVLGPVHLTVSQAKIRWGGWRHPLGVQVNNVSLRHEQHNLRLDVPHLLVSLKFFPLLVGVPEIGRVYFDDAKMYDSTDAHQGALMGNVSGKLKLKGKKVTLQSDFKAVNVMAFVNRSQGVLSPPNIDLSLQGSLTIKGSQKEGITYLDLSCESMPGQRMIGIPIVYPVPFSIDHVHLMLSGTGQKIIIKSFGLKRGESTLDIQGTLHSAKSWRTLYDQGGSLLLSLEGRGKNIPVDDLGLLWPRGLSPKARNWVVHQLSKGHADYVETKLEASADFESGGTLKRLHVPVVMGKIDASGIQVNYFGDLPPVLNTSGQCTFTRQQFFIDATGEANGVKITNGKIVIDGLDVKDQTIDIILDLQGSVRNSLEIIAREPLKFAQKLDLNPAHISGKSLTKLHLAFPLETDLPLDLIHVNAQSKIDDGEMIYDQKLKGKQIRLTNGKFDLTVDSNSLELKGEGSLQGIKNTLQWKEYFDTDLNKSNKIPFRRQFLLNTNLDTKKVEAIGFSIGESLSGISKTQMKYTVGIDAVGQIEVDMDLTPLIMVSPFLPWQKEKGEPAHLKFILQKKPQQESIHVVSARLNAPNLEVNAKGYLGNQATDWVTFPNLKIEKSDISPRIHLDQDGNIQVDLKGKFLDLSHVLDDRAPEPLLKQSPPDLKSDSAKIHVNLDIDEISLGEKNPKLSNSIHQVKGDLLYHAHTLMRANVEAKAQHNNESMSLFVSPVSSEQQKFILKAGDGGHLLEMLGTGYDIEGGRLSIEGVKSEKGDDWEVVGQIKIADFTVNKAPVLARILSAASLQGLINFFSGKGIHFHEGAGHFSISEKNLTIKDVRLMSPALGLMLNGTMDREHHTVNFTGDLVPLYIANALLAQVPVVGQLISGGNHDGVFMTRFTLSGDRQDPTLNINPISTVTPGLMRGIFDLKSTE